MENNRVDEGTREHGALRTLGLIVEKTGSNHRPCFGKNRRGRKKREKRGLDMEIRIGLY